MNIPISGRWLGLTSNVVPVPTLGFRHVISIVSNFPFSPSKNCLSRLPINNLEHFLSCKFQYTNFPLCYFVLLMVISSTKYPLTLFLHFALFIIHHLHMFSHIFHHYHPCHQNIFLIKKLLCNFISIMLCSRYSGTHSYPLCIVLGLGLYIFSFDNYIHLCAW